MRGYLYVMGATRYWFRYKVGISNNPKFRRRMIDDSLRGRVVLVSSCKVFFPYFWEQSIHKVFSPLNARMHGSGKTEWFWFGISPIPTLLIWTCFALEWLGIFFIVFFTSTLMTNGTDQDTQRGVQQKQEGVPGPNAVLEGARLYDTKVAQDGSGHLVEQTAVGNTGRLDCGRPKYR